MKTWQAALWTVLALAFCAVIWYALQVANLLSNVIDLTRGS